MKSPKLTDVFLPEAVDIKKLHKPEDMMAEVQKMASESSASMAAILKFLDVHKKDADWPEYIKARIPYIRTTLQKMDSATNEVLQMLEKFKGALPAEKEANKPAGGTFEEK